MNLGKGTGNWHLFNVNLYTYGSLRLQKIWDGVVARSFETRPAVLTDHVALKVRGQLYPGLVRQSGGQTTGLAYLDVDPPSIRALDAFEGDFYERVAVKVQLENGDLLDCDAYRVRPEHHNLLLEEQWDFDEFRERLVDRFVSDFLK